MLANPRVSGYLMQALDHELSVVEQFLSQAHLCALWELDREAAYFQREAGEELKHAGLLIRHMLTLGLAPRAAQLAAVRLGHDIGALLERDLELEIQAVNLYSDASLFCRRMRDDAAACLFEQLLRDEQEHAAELTRMLDALHNNQEVQW